MRSDRLDPASALTSTTPVAPSFTPETGDILGTHAIRVRRDGEDLALSVAVAGSVRAARISVHAMRAWTDRVSEMLAFTRSSPGEPGAEIRTPFLAAMDADPVIAIRCVSRLDGPRFLLCCAQPEGQPVEIALEAGEVDALVRSARSITALG